MTITLYDVAMILRLHINGLTLVGSNLVREGRRWLTWPDYYNELLGHHPVLDVVYIDS